MLPQLRLALGIGKGKWQDHLKAAQASGMSLAGYAAQHGINAQSLYDARHARLKAKARPARKTSAFVPIRLTPHAPANVAPDTHQTSAVAALAIQARLGNGVVLSWTHDASGGQRLADLMHTLAGLPCFA